MASAFKQFELRSVVKCHTLDVRCLAQYPEANGFVSGSRDKLAKLYQCSTNNKFEEIYVFHGPTHFVSSTCVLQRANDQGYDIFVGSNDGKIYQYEAANSEPVAVLEGHSSTVCTLSGYSDSNLLISGSWDKTAAIWKQNKKWLILEEHEATVWCVCFFANGIVLTGSADKSIKIWKFDSDSPVAKCEITLTKHTDCVRDLKRLNQKQFLSCANDATVMHWDMSGQLLATYYGHENYIYSMVLLSNEQDAEMEFASCSEDKTLRIWKNGQTVQTIRLPASTLWCVDRLQNGDLAVGTSTGKVYVFTRDPSLMASVDERKQLEEELSKSTVPMAELGDINVKKLPGKDALNQPGDKDGKTKLIREGDSIQVYQWSALRFEWQKVGDVVGTANSSKDPSQKKEYEGKLYDFVFTVDIEDGAPPLRLPYNLDQNPWQVAQEFIHRHELSQAYLEQIVSFIEKNSQGSATTGAAGSSGSTGANFDPLTGGSSYSSGSASSSDKPDKNEFYPVPKFYIFEALNIDGVTKKLREFNEKIPTGGFRLKVEDIKSLLQLTSPSNDVTETQLNIIKELIKWPRDYLFPVIDLLKACVLLPRINEEFCTGPDSSEFLVFLTGLATDKTSTPNQFLALRCICNLFSQPAGEKLMRTYQPSLHSLLTQYSGADNKNVQCSLASMCINLALLCNRQKDGQELSTDLLLKCLALLKPSLDPEAQFRVMQAMGTLLVTQKHLRVLIASNEVAEIFVHFTSNQQPERTRRCATLLMQLIKTPA